MSMNAQRYSTAYRTVLVCTTLAATLDLNCYKSCMTQTCGWWIYHDRTLLFWCCWHSVCNVMIIVCHIVKICNKCNKISIIIFYTRLIYIYIFSQDKSIYCNFLFQRFRVNRFCDWLFGCFASPIIWSCYIFFFC